MKIKRVGYDGYWAEFKLGWRRKIETTLQFFFSRFDLNSKFKFMQDAFSNSDKVKYFIKTQI
jgi:hypothetical protein